MCNWTVQFVCLDAIYNIIFRHSIGPTQSSSINRPDPVQTFYIQSASTQAYQIQAVPIFGCDINLPSDSGYRRQCLFFNFAIAFHRLNIHLMQSSMRAWFAPAPAAWFVSNQQDQTPRQYSTRIFRITPSRLQFGSVSQDQICVKWARSDSSPICNTHFSNNPEIIPSRLQFGRVPGSNSCQISMIKHVSNLHYLRLT